MCSWIVGAFVSAGLCIFTLYVVIAWKWHREDLAFDAHCCLCRRGPCFDIPECLKEPQWLAYCQPCVNGKHCRSILFRIHRKTHCVQRWQGGYWGKEEDAGLIEHAQSVLRTRP